MSLFSSPVGRISCRILDFSFASRRPGNRLNREASPRHNNFRIGISSGHLNSVLCCAGKEQNAGYSKMVSISLAGAHIRRLAPLGLARHPPLRIACRVRSVFLELFLSPDTSCLPQCRPINHAQATHVPAPTDDTSPGRLNLCRPDHGGSVLSRGRSARDILF